MDTNSRRHPEALMPVSAIALTSGIGVYNQAVKHSGLDDATLLDLYEVIDLYSGLNRLNIGLQTRADEKPWHG